MLTGRCDTVVQLLAQGAIRPAWLQAHGLAAWTWYTVRATPGLPAEVATALRSSYYATVVSAELHQHELEAVLQALAEQHIVPILFKGAALTQTVYPDRVCRPMGDLDLWLTAEEMPRAQAALESLGYVQRTKSTRPLDLMRQHSGEIQMVSQQKGRGLVELHWGTFAGVWLRRVACVDEKGIRERAVPLTSSWPALTLAPEDSLIQLAIHFAVNHQLATPWLRALVDVALLARAQPVDWDVVVERARVWRVSTAVWLVLKLAVELTGLKEAASAVARLSPSPLRHWLLGLFANEQSLINLRNITRTPLRFVYQLLLIDRGRDAARLFFRALWPEREWLAARYGQTGVMMQLCHLAHALQGKP